MIQKLFLTCLGLQKLEIIEILIKKRSWWVIEVATQPFDDKKNGPSSSVTTGVQTVIYVQIG